MRGRYHSALIDPRERRLSVKQVKWLRIAADLMVAASAVTIIGIGVYAWRPV